MLIGYYIPIKVIQLLNSLAIGFFGDYEEFLHTSSYKYALTKNRLEVKLLCSCSLTSAVVQGNAMKLTKNLMRCVHLKDTKYCGRIINSPWWNMKGIMLMFIQCHAWWFNPSFFSIRPNIYIQPPNLTCIGFLKRLIWKEPCYKIL
jgi:hypothetical protein